jgi:hypothetical protein
MIAPLAGDVLLPKPMMPSFNVVLPVYVLGAEKIVVPALPLVMLRRTMPLPEIKPLNVCTPVAFHTASSVVPVPVLLNTIGRENVNPLPDIRKDVVPVPVLLMVIWPPVLVIESVLSSILRLTLLQIVELA